MKNLSLISTIILLTGFILFGGGCGPEEDDNTDESGEICFTPGDTIQFYDGTTSIFLSPLSPGDTIQFSNKAGDTIQLSNKAGDTIQVPSQSGNPVYMIVSGDSISIP